MKQREANKSVLFNVGKEMWHLYACQKQRTSGITMRLLSRILIAWMNTTRRSLKMQ